MQSIYEIVVNILQTMSVGNVKNDVSVYFPRKIDFDRLNYQQRAHKTLSSILKKNPILQDDIIDDHVLIIGRLDLDSKNNEVLFCSFQAYYSTDKKLIDAKAHDVKYMRLDYHLDALGQPLSHYQPHMHIHSDPEFRGSSHFCIHPHPLVNYLFDLLRHAFPTKWHEWAMDVWSENGRGYDPVEMYGYYGQICELHKSSKQELIFRYREDKEFKSAYIDFKTHLKKKILSISAETNFNYVFNKDVMELFNVG